MAFPRFIFFFFWTTPPWLLPHYRGFERSAGTVSEFCSLLLTVSSSATARTPPPPVCPPNFWPHLLRSFSLTPPPIGNSFFVQGCFRVWPPPPFFAGAVRFLPFGTAYLPGSPLFLSGTHFCTRFSTSFFFSFCPVSPSFCFFFYRARCLSALVRFSPGPRLQKLRVTVLPDFPTCYFRFHIPFRSVNL